MDELQHWVIVNSYYMCWLQNHSHWACRSGNVVQQAYHERYHFIVL